MPTNCPYCSRVISDQIGLETHLREDLNYAPFKCGLCFTLFHSKAAARNHFAVADTDHPGVSQPVLIEHRDPRIEDRIQSLLHSRPPVTATATTHIQVRSAIADMKEELTDTISLSLDSTSASAAAPGPRLRLCQLCDREVPGPEASHISRAHLAECAYACVSCGFLSRSWTGSDGMRTHLDAAHQLNTADKSAFLKDDAKREIEAFRRRCFGKTKSARAQRDRITAEPPNSAYLSQFPAFFAETSIQPTLLTVTQAAKSSKYKLTKVCVFCNVDIATDVRRHIIHHHLDATAYAFACHICELKLDDWIGPDGMRAHVLSAHDLKDPKAYRFADVSDELMESLKNKCIKKALQHTIEEYPSLDKTDNPEHSVVEDGEDVREMSGRSRMCLVCGQLVPGHRARHVASHLGPGEGFFACSDCDETEEDWPALRAHLLTAHGKGGSKRYQYLRAAPDRLADLTRLCFGQVANPSTRSDDTRRVTCELCAKSLNWTGKSEHAASHLLLPMFTCSECDRVFRGNKKADILIHIESVHRIPRESVRAGVHFADHRSEHTDEMRVKLIECFGSAPQHPLKPNNYSEGTTENPSE